jgi:hypothetical protein
MNDADALARGDILPEDVSPEDKDLDPEHPDAEKAVAELETKLEEEKAEEGDEKESRKDTRIPESRHKAILEKEREKRADLERQLAQYQNGQQVANVNEQITAAEDSIMKMEKEYANLLTDGEIDKAAEKMQLIRRAERDMAEAKSDMKIHAAEIRATERARYNTSLERIENAFPELNPDHDSYDADLMGEVAELKDAYQMKGLTPTAALQKAVKALVEPRTTRQEMATNANPRVNDKDVAAERKKDAVEKTSKAMGKQPSNLNRGGVDSDRMGGRKDINAVMNMTQKEFAALSEADLAAMRGDTL